MVVRVDVQMTANRRKGDAQIAQVFALPLAGRLTPQMRPQQRGERCARLNPLQPDIHQQQQLLRRYAFDGFRIKLERTEGEKCRVERRAGVRHIARSLADKVRERCALPRRETCFRAWSPRSYVHLSQLQKVPEEM